jgi:hypothetical protein
MSEGRKAVIALLTWALTLAAPSGCGDGTEPRPPVVLDGALLGEFEGQRQYKLSAVTLRLWVGTDEPSVSGLWQMSYSTTTATDEGSFTGTYVDGMLTLELTVMDGCAGAYTVSGSALDELGYRWELSVSPSGQCHNYANAGPISVQKVSDIAGFP